MREPSETDSSYTTRWDLTVRQRRPRHVGDRVECQTELPAMHQEPSLCAA
jgi:hypothetical protein